MRLSKLKLINRAVGCKFDLRLSRPRAPATDSGREDERDEKSRTRGCRDGIAEDGHGKSSPRRRCGAKIGLSLPPCNQPDLHASLRCANRPGPGGSFAARGPPRADE